jgi:hypothetical protein
VLIMARDSRRIRGEDQSLGRRTGFWRGTGVPEPMPWRDRIGGVILEGDGFLFGGVIIIPTLLSFFEPPKPSVSAEYPA